MPLFQIELGQEYWRRLLSAMYYVVSFTSIYIILFSYLYFAKSVHSLITYKLNPFSISEYVVVRMLVNGSGMFLNGAPNTNGTSVP